MDRIMRFCILSLAIITFQGCRDGNLFLPSSTGAPNEVLVVIEKSLWESAPGIALYDILNEPVVGLPQNEANFKISNVSPKQFDSILKPVRNIIIVRIDPAIYSKAKFSYEYDVWAKPQAVLYINAPDVEQFEKYINDNGRFIREFFINVEIKRSVQGLEKSYNRALSDSLTKHMNVLGYVPADMIASKEGKDFFWASNGQAGSRIDFVVYSVPYTNANQFTPEVIIATRDSVMKANIPGEPEGSYMKTQTALAPEYRAINFNNKYNGELRGLWEMQGDIMGGPFVSHTRLDEVNQRVITSEVFVYAPEKNKRNLMRRAEAILYTIKLPQENALPEIPVVFEKEQEKK